MAGEDNRTPHVLLKEAIFLVKWMDACVFRNKPLPERLISVLKSPTAAFRACNDSVVYGTQAFAQAEYIQGVA